MAYLSSFEVIENGRNNGAELKGHGISVGKRPHQQRDSGGYTTRLYSLFVKKFVNFFAFLEAQKFFFLFLNFEFKMGQRRQFPRECLLTALATLTTKN